MSVCRLNIGCGMTPTPGWINYDNSLSVKLSRCPRWLTALAASAGLISAEQAGYIAFCRDNDIRFCDATRRVPHDDESIDAIYSSHMLEHLDRAGAARFLGECRRLLKPGGVLRVAVPDLGKAIDSYKENGDADAFVDGILMAPPALSGRKDKLRLLATGYRHHLWMYDGASLCKLLKENGFSAPKVLPPGQTTIPDPGTLDLAERAGESVYAEARKP